MSQGTDFAYRVEHTGTSLMVAAIDHSHVGIVDQSLFDSLQIRLFKHTELEVDVWYMVHLTHFHRTGVIGAIIDYQDLFPFRNEGIDGDVNIDGAISIADVSSLIDCLLDGDTISPLADVNLDGDITIADVSALIDFLLDAN